MSGSAAHPERKRIEARLFPLPDLVMFPHVVQPLHLFEPRYVAMLDAALASDRLIAMALLRENWQGTYFDRPPIHSTVCLGRVISDTRLEDGRYNILLAGLSRARVARELPVDTPYRSAEIELLPDVYSGEDAADRRQLQQQLLARFREFYPAGVTATESWQQMLQGHVSLGMLVDVVAFVLPLPLPAKQELLACPLVEQRARSLIEQLQLLQDSVAEPRSPGFPPSFSDN